jgi:AcrR family transcriptional regulator
VLVEAPHSSLSEVAEALGIGRTTLHRMFATRRDLLSAIAHDAVGDLARIYAEAGIGAHTPAGGDVVAVLRRLVGAMIPLGPKLMFLLRAPELRGDEDLDRRIDALDEPVRAAIGRARDHGALRPEVPLWWAAEMLFAGVFVAWEQIDVGRLAPLDAPDLVMNTWLAGTAAHDHQLGQR